MGPGRAVGVLVAGHYFPDRADPRSHDRLVQRHDAVRVSTGALVVAVVWRAAPQPRVAGSVLTVAVGRGGRYGARLDAWRSGRICAGARPVSWPAAARVRAHLTHGRSRDRASARALCAVRPARTNRQASRPID